MKPTKYANFLQIAICLSLTGCMTTGSSLNASDIKSFEESNTPKHQMRFIKLTPQSLALTKKQRIQAKSDPQLAEALLRYQYRIGPGDILNITVWDHPELTIPAGSYRSSQESGNWVHADGTIFYPYIGFVKVEGKTVIEVRKVLTEKLKEYIENPQIDVNLAAFRSQKAYITGAVTKPGTQAITNIPLTLVDAVNNAAGLKDNANWQQVTLTRNGKEETVSLYALLERGDQTQNRLLQHGDIVHVPLNDSQKVFVLGEVNEPKLLQIDRAGMSLTEALSEVGGINQLEADATGVFVIRTDHPKKSITHRSQSTTSKTNQIAKTKEAPQKTTQIFQLDIKDATALAIGVEFELQPYDIVYVTAAPITKWNRVVRQLLPTISGFNELSESALRIKTWP